jgi:hypothetical protein
MTYITLIAAYTITTTTTTTVTTINMNKIPQHKGNDRWFTCHRKKYFVKYCSLCPKMAIEIGCGLHITEKNIWLTIVLFA